MICPLGEIRIENVSHTYDGRAWALLDVNINFESRKTYALVGPSGCGKTTLLKIICGLIKPTKGKIYMDEVDITNTPPEKRNIAIVFQFPVVYKMSVLENLMFPLINTGLSKSEKIRRTKEIASQLKIEDILNFPAQKLSPADKQKVAIGRALVRDTDLILLDEPLSAIEPDRKYEIKKLLLNISKNLKKTMIFVTHDQTEALTFGEKIAIMSAGKILQFGTFEEIYYKPTCEMVGFFIGYPGMNILKAVLEEPDTITVGSLKFKLPSKDIAQKLGIHFKIGIRPEHIDVSTLPKEGYVPFKVLYTENLGRNKSVIHLRNDDLNIKALYEGEIRGISEVWAKLDSRFICFFDLNGNRVD